MKMMKGKLIPLGLCWLLASASTLGSEPSAPNGGHSATPDYPEVAPSFLRALEWRSIGPYRGGASPPSQATRATRWSSTSGHHDMWIDPRNPDDRMIQGNDGGAAVTLNGGVTWSRSIPSRHPPSVASRSTTGSPIACTALSRTTQPSARPAGRMTQLALCRDRKGRVRVLRCRCILAVAAAQSAGGPGSRSPRERRRRGDRHTRALLLDPGRRGTASSDHDRSDTVFGAPVQRHTQVPSHGPPLRQC